MVWGNVEADSGTIEGLLRFDDNFNLKLEPKQNKQSVPDKITCPKCKSGTILKGKTAYGCSEYKSGCDFVFSFDAIKNQAKGKILTKNLVHKILTTFPKD